MIAATVNTEKIVTPSTAGMIVAAVKAESNSRNDNRNSNRWNDNSSNSRNDYSSQFNRNDNSSKKSRNDNQSNSRKDNKCDKW